MSDHDGSWRIAVLDDTTVVGGGFVVSASHALTCAHVVAGRAFWSVRRFGHSSPLGSRPASTVDAYDAGNHNADIGVIDLPVQHAGRAASATSTAPLGPPTPPTDGTIVGILGLPEGREREGRWVQAVVVGADRSGEWLQIDALNNHSAWVERGFSGAAAVDQGSGLVVGMVVRTNRNPQSRNAWLIPLATIAAYWPALGSRLKDGLLADPDFRRFRMAFDSRHYADALNELGTVQRRFPERADVYYFWALAALGGCRPARHAGETIDGVVRLLLEALRLSPRFAAATALLAFVCEDYFALRHLPVPHLPGVRLAVPGELTAAQAREILDHVPATDCTTWRGIYERSSR
jgi:hypothetical protein